MVYVTNALSLNMLPELACQGCFRVHRLTLEQARAEAREFRGELVSAIGHKDTAAVVGNLLGMEVPCSRQSIKLHEQSDRLLVAQYSGPRLPEGATELPQGARIDWFDAQWLDVRSDPRAYWYSGERGA